MTSRPTFEERQWRREGCRVMRDALGGRGQKPFQHEPEPVRLRGSRDARGRIGNIARAGFYQRRPAEIETREPEQGRGP
jgi:hypothetical protein